MAELVNLRQSRLDLLEDLRDIEHNFMISFCKLITSRASGCSSVAFREGIEEFITLDLKDV